MWHTTKHYYKPWNAVYQRTLTLILLSPKYNNRLWTTFDPTTDGQPEWLIPTKGKFVQAMQFEPYAGSLRYTAAFTRVYLQQFYPSLGADSAILGEQHLQPACNSNN
jgi:hypothetical protein